MSLLMPEMRQDHAAMLYQLAGKGPTPKFTMAELSARECQFTVRGWFPCMVAYGEWAPRLFSRARRRDLDSLLKLLAIDKSVLGEGS
jgi:hypothetical protein